MKKYFLILAVLVSVAFFALADDIVDVRVLSPEESLIETDSLVSFNEQNLNGDVIETGFKVILDKRIYRDLEVMLQIDSEHNTLGYSKDGKWYEMDSRSADIILSDPFFDRYFPYRHFPAMVAVMNGEEISLEAQSKEWVVHLPDGNVRTQVEESNQVNSWILQSGSALAFEFELKPDSLTVSDINGTTFDLNDGEFILPDIEAVSEYVVTATWDQSEYSGIALYEFDAIVDLQAVARIGGDTIRPGEFFTVIVENSLVEGPMTVDQPFVSDADYYEIGNEKICIIPVNYWFDPGEYDLSIKFPETNDEIDLQVAIEARKFDIQYLYIDEAIEAETRSDEAYEEYDLYMIPARETSSDVPLFSGRFIMPVEGRISTEFGMYRYVNDSLTSYRHSGIDIAIDRGTPIVATNSGKVALARELILTGNTVVIDHGLGIFSVHFHMDSLNVEKGDFVEQGEMIGTVGSTGFSTGPHLHWTMSYYRTNLDPYQFIQTEILP